MQEALAVVVLLAIRVTLRRVFGRTFLAQLVEMLERLEMQGQLGPQEAEATAVQAPLIMP